jgi:hypothetical protein
MLTLNDWLSAEYLALKQVVSDAVSLCLRHKSFCLMRFTGCKPEANAFNYGTFFTSNTQAWPSAWV